MQPPYDPMMDSSRPLKPGNAIVTGANEIAESTSPNPLSDRYQPTLVPQAYHATLLPWDEICFPLTDAALYAVLIDLEHPNGDARAITEFLNASTDTHRQDRPATPLAPVYRSFKLDGSRSLRNISTRKNHHH